MRYCRKMICCVFTFLVLVQIVTFTGYAEETEPLLVSDSEEKVLPEDLLEEEIQENLLPEEVETEELITEETLPEETLPEAVVPEETLPEETPNYSEMTVPDEELLPEDYVESVLMVYESVPLYLQTDYPDVRYGSGTIETSGCSITSLAMVATYLTGHEYRPDELARYFGGRAENNIARLEYGCQTLQLPYEKNHNWHTTLQALQEGKIAIVLLNHKSVFTDSQHFVVLTGLTEEGKVLVNDPFGPNYDRWELQDGFANGFDPYQIVNGFSGAWVFDQKAIEPDPFIYFEEEPQREESRYTEIDLTEEEIDLMARVVWAEARGECKDGQQAVAEVVLNRLVSESFPNNLYDVIYGQDQFRSVPYLEKAEPNQIQYEAIENAIYGPYILPMDVVYFATWATNDNIWGTIENHIFCYPEE